MISYRINHFFIKRILFRSQLHTSRVINDGSFISRHIGPTEKEQKEMLEYIGFKNMEEFITKVVPPSIRMNGRLKLMEPISESEMLELLAEKMSKNIIAKSYIGLGFYNTYTPPVILRNIFENPGWYTSYTPYQPEISQGRMESLFNFQTMVSDLTKLPISNASLLDEGSAAAEAIGISVRKTKRNKIIMDENCHVTTKAVVLSRAEAMNIDVIVMNLFEKNDLLNVNFNEIAGIIVQYPNTYGCLHYDKIKDLGIKCKNSKTLLCVATDLLALTLIKPPGELGADIAFGSAQRFGIPLGFGGPSAAFFATSSELLRFLPGRIIGQSIDKYGNPAYRLTLQTREQHIRRDKATSNICTSQNLLANISVFYAIYHGPKGLRKIATNIHDKTIKLAESLRASGCQILNSGDAVFDTIHFKPNLKMEVIKQHATERLINLRYKQDESIVISLDETTKDQDLKEILEIFKINTIKNYDQSDLSISKNMTRTSQFMTHPVFNSYHNETGIMRYMKTLENKDVSLVHSIIPLGSCTMKLNAAAELMPCSWRSVNQIHPFVPRNQVIGFIEMIKELEEFLAEITGYYRVCLTPNSGAQGEYAGLRAIRGYLKSIGQSHRKVCLIPLTAHGTNPASAVLAGMEVKPIRTTNVGSINISDLKEQLDKFKNNVAALMITYPSTSGVFDEEIQTICELVHEAGAQVYLDGANMNAQVGLCRPGDYGSDVSHLNLHKTFCIPHGGGGPGVGPIGVKKHLAPFLPTNPLGTTLASSTEDLNSTDNLAVCSAPFGSAGILPIPWAYIRMMGPEGLKKATEVAMLSANYMMHKLKEAYPTKYTNKSGLCAHEFILDCSEFKKQNVEVIDISKRLMDFGFHSPTMSFPIPSSLMIEPTESEPMGECDRLCEALITIREEIQKITENSYSYENSPLKNAPHTLEDLVNEKWDRLYSREKAAFPGSWQIPKYHGKAQQKIWPSISRLNDTYGDQNVICTCS